ncbi:MAG: GTP-binding protein [Desulfurivibrio sp.]|nr:MAG: GTP-binding protein [Desulfurivibrio sp.]
MEPRTPIMLITGSLGSGKTTLLRRILTQTSGRRLAVLMNEFGEISIDSKVIEGEHVRIVELAGGCVCCSLTGEFEAAVREILQQVRPECIVVEATGVAEADSLVYEVEDNLPEVRLDCVICIVDADISIRFPAVGYTARTQLNAADVILLNKTDLVSPAELREVEEQVRRFSAARAIFHTVACGVDIDLLFGPHLPGERRSQAGSATPPGPRFDSFTYQSGKLFSEQAFRELVDKLPAEVFRAKGFVRTAGGSLLFNYVAGRSDFERFPAEKTRLVFIGRDLAGSQEEILRQLQGCEQQDAL